MEDKEITFSCEKCPLNKLDKTLKNILKGNGVSSAFVYSKGEPVKLRRVIVLKAVNGKGDVEHPDVEESDSAIESQVDVLNKEATLEQLLTRADDTSDLNNRISAIESLILHLTDNRVRKKLSELSNDPDFHFRLLALGLLGNFVPDWPEVEDILIKAMYDTEPSVRQLALQTLIENEGEKTKDALNIAIHDKDPLICNQAKEYLNDDSIICKP
ncbi:MAG: HEAT repeat domain-containing protein [Nitrospirae bacterium]|nr:HEAT repeat domain-containing protein [Nitrospirota bacterium]